MKNVQKKQYKVLITGGHVTPAVATIEQMKKRYPSWDIVFVGRKKALEGASVVSEEYSLIQSLGIRFVPLIAGRIKRDLSFYTLWSLLKIPIGFFHAWWVVAFERPDVIVSFGGYVAAPIVATAWCMRIPIVTHEQTTAPGLANRLIARCATKICTSFPGQESLFSKPIIYTGLPIRQSMFDSGGAEKFQVDAHVPLLFVTGGNTGSMSINDVVYQALPQLLDHYTIIHQVGRVSASRAQAVKQSGPKELMGRYHPVAYMDASTYSWVMHHAALIIGRSGANTVMEVATLGRMALWIPLPWAAGDEQASNAKWLEQAGGARVLAQSTLTVESLVTHVNEMITHKNIYLDAAEKFAKTIPHDGADKLVDVVASLKN